MYNENEVTKISKDYMKFHELMLHRVFNILLVSSLYDYFTLEKDGILEDRLLTEFKSHDLQYAPRIRHVTTGEKALLLLKEHSFGLIIISAKLADMNMSTFINQVKEQYIDTPIILLANVTDDIKSRIPPIILKQVDNIFVWTGDSRLLFAITKLLEDKKNVDNDIKVGNVRVIIVVEDNPRFYSLFFPMVYSEIIKHNNALIEHGVNIFDRMIRMRSRPKILLAKNFEEALSLFNKYQSNVLGIISDISFPLGEKMNHSSGFILAEKVKAIDCNIPVILQSSESLNREKVEKVGAHFVNKNSKTLLQELRAFILGYFGFGDFVFRDESNNEICRAPTMKEFEKILITLPEASLKKHSEHNHFSHWLFAHGEFELANTIRPFTIKDFNSIQDLRTHLLSMIKKTKKEHIEGKVSDFKKESFDSNFSFVKIGMGSLGGKGRSLAFLNTLLANRVIKQKFEDVNICIPKSIVIASDFFDEFILNNKLDNAISELSEDDLRHRFISSELPPYLVKSLAFILEYIKVPIAVRSSSHFEDSNDQPFAGLYATYMLPNNHPKLKVRLNSLATAIKAIYASTFSKEAQSYFNSTSFRLEEERMSIVIQELVGNRYDNYYYPNFSGVAQSYNYYPIGHMNPNDGIVSVVLGFGKTVVDGGTSFRFCPKYPNILPQFTNPIDYLRFTQKEFYALDLNFKEFTPNSYKDIERFPLLNLKEAEKHGTLNPVGGHYSRENDIMCDGIWGDGPRVVNFSNILKNKLFPLSEILTNLLNIVPATFGSAIEMEFAVTLKNTENEISNFYILQTRPFLAKCELQAVKIENTPQEKILCFSTNALGNGRVEGITDIVYVIPEKFDKLRTLDIATEIGEFNEKIISKGKKYLLIGIGRWGTSEATLGIPVSWSQISGADVIVEASIEGFSVEPSNGTHFFHNITACKNAYLTINYMNKKNMIDWNWLQKQVASTSKEFTRHIELKKELKIKVNGHDSRGVIEKPE